VALLMPAATQGFPFDGLPTGFVRLSARRFRSASLRFCFRSANRLALLASTAPMVVIPSSVRFDIVKPRAFFDLAESEGIPLRRKS